MGFQQGLLEPQPLHNLPVEDSPYISLKGLLGPSKNDAMLTIGWVLEMGRLILQATGQS